MYNVISQVPSPSSLGKTSLRIKLVPCDWQGMAITFSRSVNNNHDGKKLKTVMGMPQVYGAGFYEPPASLSHIYLSSLSMNIGMRAGKTAWCLYSIAETSANFRGSVKQGALVQLSEAAPRTHCLPPARWCLKFSQNFSLFLLQFIISFKICGHRLQHNMSSLEQFSRRSR